LTPSRRTAIAVVVTTAEQGESRGFGRDLSVAFVAEAGSSVPRPERRHLGALSGAG
jgi:hypothetical protein